MDRTRASARISDIAEQCVKCGLCLPHCPTYRLHGHEAQSPRGRLTLMQHATRNEDAPDKSTEHALSQCLSCGQCERHCPLHLPFTEALDLHRSRTAASAPWPSGIMEHPRLMAILTTCLRWTPRFLLRLLPHAEVLVALQHRATTTPIAEPAQADQRDTASMLFILPGCVGTLWDRTTLNAIAGIARRRGLSPRVLPGVCCGGLARHQGREGVAKALADWNGASLVQVDTGCRAAWQHALPQHRILDAIEWLDSFTDLRFRRSTEAIAVHWPCTGTDRQREALRRQLRRVPGLRWRELIEHAGCCGAGGDAFLREPDQSAAFRASWLADWSREKEPIVLSMNIGCSVHLAGSIESFRATMKDQTLAQPDIEHPAAFLARHLETDT